MVLYSIVSIFLLLKALKSRDAHCMCKMFGVYVRPIPDFASPVFNSVRAKNIQVLEAVQRRFTRIIFHRSTSPWNPSFGERLVALNCVNLFSRRCVTDLKVLHAVIHCRLNVSLSTEFSIIPSPVRGMERPRLLDSKCAVTTTFSNAKNYSVSCRTMFERSFTFRCFSTLSKPTICHLHLHRHRFTCRAYTENVNKQTIKQGIRRLLVATIFRHKPVFQFFL